jgi:hypothetical protein
MKEDSLWMIIEAMVLIEECLGKIKNITFAPESMSIASGLS